MGTGIGNGIINTPSLHTVDEVVEELEALLKAKGVTLFALVDHSGEAARAGMTMRPTKLLIFGDPRAGTPLMLASPSIALDLPLKILAWEDADGKVWLSYNSAEWLKERHSLPDEFLPVINGVAKLAEKVVSKER
jgi:uncharacterized protein (DUF302 family)